MIDTKQRLFAALGACVLAGAVAAQDYPNKPVRIIVNVGAGSSPDVVARAVAVPLGQALGQPIVIENRTGANGQIGADAVLKAGADGYTILMSSGSAFTITPHTGPKFPFDPNKELTPVAAGARITVFLMTKPSLPVNNYAEFIAYARANPGKLSYGSSGQGSTAHLATEMLAARAGFQAVHVPYRGAGQALADLMAGQIDFVFDPGVGLSHARAGKVKLLATAASKRSFAVPDTPTIDELGVRGFEAGITHGFYVPTGTPAPVLARLNAEINKALATTQVIQQIRAIGAEPTPMSAAEFRALLDAESVRYGRVVRENKIVGE